MEEAISLQLSELGPGDEIDLFEFSRLLGHRLGLASWAGREILHSPRFRELVAALDALDGAEAFVRPARMATVAVSDKAAEREAMAQAEEILIETISARTERRVMICWERSSNVGATQPLPRMRSARPAT